MCCDAVFKDSCAYEFVPDEFKTQAMSDYVVECEPRLFEFVPESFISREVKDMLIAFNEQISESEEEISESYIFP